MTTAHRAGAGLGEVFVQARGGLVWNAGDGIRRVERTGGAATTATVGETVVAAGDVLPRAIRIATEGAALR